MRISVIIPTCNEASNVGSLVRHLRKHGGDLVAEYIVVDSCSQDNTLQVAKDAGATVLCSPCRGRNHQMNYAARHATGDIFYFVHADTLPPDTYAQDVVSAVEEGYSIGSYRFRFNSNRPLLRMNSWFTRFDRMWCRGGDQTLFVTRELFESLDGYDEDFVIMEEYEFMRRARRQTRFRILPKDVIVSARKYELNSYLRVNLANFVVFTMFRFGSEPERMLRTYRRMLNHRD